MRTIPVFVSNICFALLPLAVWSHRNFQTENGDGLLTNHHESSTGDLANKFPTIEETLEMARLSRLAYSFRKYSSEQKAEEYCQEYSDDSGLECHWYHHNPLLGTQVLIVSNYSSRYLAVVFAGTDDVRTSLEDIDIAKKSFGNNDNIRLVDKNIKVHAGFNNAVFHPDIFEEIVFHLNDLQMHHHHHYRKIYTTGHSLGAANSVLLATALALSSDELKSDAEFHGHQTEIVSINFGCPRTGNMAWRNYLNSTSPLHSRLGIWRVVLGWDLVPRLPDFFEHVGHTIQLWSENHHKYDTHSKDVVVCYYKHYGDVQRGYAGVPPGWASKPYAWVPGALLSHHIDLYLEYLEILNQQQIWVNSFKKIQPIGYDDDIYDEPPDDWYALDWAYGEGETILSTHSKLS